jgi:hypothetical protein
MSLSYVPPGLSGSSLHNRFLLLKPYLGNVPDEGCKLQADHLKLFEWQRLIYFDKSGKGKIIVALSLVHYTIKLKIQLGNNCFDILLALLQHMTLSNLIRLIRIMEF